MVERTIESMDLDVGYYTKGQVLEDNKYGSNSFLVYDLSIDDSTQVGKKVLP